MIDGNCSIILLFDDGYFYIKNFLEKNCCFFYFFIFLKKIMMLIFFERIFNRGCGFKLLFLDHCWSLLKIPLIESFTSGCGLPRGGWAGFCAPSIGVDRPPVLFFVLFILKFFYGDVSQVFFIYRELFQKKIFNFLFFRELLVTNGRGPTRGGSGGYVRHLLGRIVSQRLFFKKLILFWLMVTVL